MRGNGTQRPGLAPLCSRLHRGVWDSNPDRSAAPAGHQYRAAQKESWRFMATWHMRGVLRPKNLSRSLGARPGNRGRCPRLQCTVQGNPTADEQDLVDRVRRNHSGNKLQFLLEPQTQRHND